MITSNYQIKIFGITLLFSLVLLVWFFFNSEQRSIKKDRIEPFDKARQSMQYYIDKRVAVGDRTLNIEDYIKADKQLAKMNKMLFKSNSSWQTVGPNSTGGRIRKIVIDPSDPNILFAAAASGGVWKSINGGQNWTTVFTTYANIATNALAMDPYNSQVLYAGTGEGYFGFDSILGNGIYKTINGGQSWFHLDSLAIDTTINDIVLSKVNSNIIYAATSVGLYQSTDAGATWTNIFWPSHNGGCLDLAIKNDNSVDYLFVSCGTLGQAGVYRNINVLDSKNFWQPSLTIDPNMGRTTIAIAPSNQDVIYALSASIESDPNKKDGFYKFYKSTSSGSLWQPMADNSSTDKPTRALLSEPIGSSAIECGFGSQNYYSNQGWHNNAIAVDPLNENRIWVGGVVLFRSDDSGLTWGAASYWPGVSGSHYVHADIHSITFHPNYNGSSNQSLFVSNDGGVFKTNNANAAVSSTANAFPNQPLCNFEYIDVTWQNLNQDLAVTQFNHGAIFPSGDKYWGGTQDNGFLLGSQSSGLNWQRISSGDGSHVEINKNNLNIMYANGFGMNFKKSTDAGMSFQSATNGFINFGALFVNPFAIDPNNQDRLWISSLEYIYRTDDAANSWHRVNSNLLDILGSAIAVSPQNSDLVLVGTASGDIYKTTIATTATSSTVWDVSFPRIGHVSSITFNPFNDNEVIATYSTLHSGAHIWKSIDAGSSWFALDGTGVNTVPDIPVLSLTYNTLNTNIMFAGTDLGVLITYDGGQNWSNANAGVIPKIPAEHVTFVDSPQFTGIYVFTYGRSVFRMAVGASLSDLIFDNNFEQK